MAPMPFADMPGAVTPHRTAGAIAATYLALALFWIYASDQILAWLVTDPAQLTFWQTGKGWLFVVASASLIYFLVRRVLTAARKSQLTLRENERYNRTLFHESPIGLALCRFNGQLVDANRAFAGIIGCTISQALQLSYWEITPEKYAEQERQQLDSLRQTGAYGPYEKEYLHRSGRLVPVRLNGCVIRRGGEDFIWSSVEDLSERSQAERQLTEQLDELRRWRQATLGREDRILQLKAEVNELLLQQGAPPRYAAAEADSPGRC
jgi:PAS domain S-box-containing protein